MKLHFSLAAFITHITPMQEEYIPLNVILLVDLYVQPNCRSIVCYTIIFMKASERVRVYGEAGYHRLSMGFRNDFVLNVAIT